MREQVYMRLTRSLENRFNRHDTVFVRERVLVHLATAMQSATSTLYSLPSILVSSLHPPLLSLLKSTMPWQPKGEVYNAQPPPDPRYASNVDVVRYVLLGDDDSDTAPILKYDEYVF